MSELFAKLKNYADSDYLPMHMPGHKRRLGELGNPFFIDITEIDGFDNLHHAEDILLEVQKQAADIYHAKESHYLVNGSTSGLLAAISACTSFGGQILMARNSHKAAYHGAFLKGLSIHYLYPPFLEDLGINGKISPKDVENSLKQNQEIQAVLITSPTYDGVVSDIRAIADLVHSYQIPLIVDSAHGAHFPFSSCFPEDALACGADLVIHSLHKTLPALTQSALLHMQGNLVDREKLRRYLAMYQTSSPSYVLMAGMEQCLKWSISHLEEFELFVKNLLWLRAELKQMSVLELIEVEGMDISKILISVKNCSLNGQELSSLLREEFHIELEMACSTYVCAMTSVADTKKELERLLNALLSIDEMLFQQGKRNASGEKLELSEGIFRTEVLATLQEVEELPQELCCLEEAVGRMSADFINLYPPGIPILAPGERISAEIVKQILLYEKEQLEVHGLYKGKVKVVKKV